MRLLSKKMAFSGFKSLQPTFNFTVLHSTASSQKKKQKKRGLGNYALPRSGFQPAEIDTLRTL